MIASSKKTLVIGASTHPDRYAYMAVTRLQQHGHVVVALGKQSGEINGIPIQTEKPSDSDFDTVTLYINPEIQKSYYHYLLNELKPRRIIFNPGTENNELRNLAEAAGIKTEYACTLVLLSTGSY